MALVDTTWYANFGNGTSTGHYAVATRPQNTAVAAGVLRRQFTAPSVGNERVFVCIVAGTTANVTDATWVLTRGAKTTDGTATWMECTGQAALNGDLTNTATWAQIKAATPAVLGQVIKRSNGASYQICTTAGAMSASEPAFSDTAGATTTDTTAVWTSLGVVGNFTGGQAPFARLQSACASTWFAPGNTVYIGNNHAETQSTGMTITTSGATPTGGRIICHNLGSYPPGTANMTTGATVSTTGTGFTIFSPVGSFYVYGVTFRGGVGGASGGGTYLGVKSVQGATNPSYYIFLDNCSLYSGPTGANNTIGIGGTTGTDTGTFVFNNCTVYFGHTSTYIAVSSAQLYWKNTGTILMGGSAIPAVLITQLSGGGYTSNITLEALDLSQLTGSLYANFSNMPATGSLLVKDCKLNAATTVTTPAAAGMTVQLVRCDSTATAYKSARYAYEGVETTETTIVRTGGATDPAGQLQSRKIVTTANAQWPRPFQAQPYAAWNATTGANVTVTVYGTGTGLPNNDDVWLEVEYLGSASTPLGTIVTTTKANLLATGAAVASDSSTWSGGGGSPFKLTTTLSSPQPGQAGYIHARVRVAKVSATYYIDPQIYLT